MNSIQKNNRLISSFNLKFSKQHSFGIVGATGAVGRTFLKVLDDYNIPVKNLRLYASTKSKGHEIQFRNKVYTVEELDGSDFKGLDVVFFSAGTNISKEYCKQAVKDGAVVIDNSNAFRMDPSVPLVIPEINPFALCKHNGLIANPNCSTIQMLIAIYPIHKINRVTKINVATYQSVSGTGLEAIETLKTQSKAYLDNQTIPSGVYPHQIAFNLFPHIDNFQENGFCIEEIKMIQETQKILNEPIKVSPTVVRVPVFYCHSEAVHIELENSVNLEQIKKIISECESIILYDNPAQNMYPMPILCKDSDYVFVGRVRKDMFDDNSILLWVVADNLRRGAATNAVFIYKELVNRNLI